MKIRINSRWAVIVPLVVAGLFGTLLAVCPASADSITFDLDRGTTPLTKAEAPFATVTVTLMAGGVSGTVAHVLFDTTGAPGTYSMGNLKAADLSVNGRFTVDNVTEDGVLLNVKTIPTNVSIDGLGPFNLRINNAGNLKKSATKIEFDLEKIVGVTPVAWASATQVLQPNKFGHVAAAHIFAQFCPDGSAHTCVGYATNNPGATIPEPGTLLLAGSALVGLGAWTRRRIRGGKRPVETLST